MITHTNAAKVGALIHLPVCLASPKWGELRLSAGQQRHALIAHTATRFGYWLGVTSRKIARPFYKQMRVASFPGSVALTQLRCTLLAVTSSQRDLYPQVCAGRRPSHKKGTLPQSSLGFGPT